MTLMNTTGNFGSRLILATSAAILIGAPLHLSAQTTVLLPETTTNVVRTYTIDSGGVWTQGANFASGITVNWGTTQDIFGNIYTSEEADLGRVLKFKTDGTPLGAIAQSTTTGATVGAGPLTGRPEAMAVGPDGNIYLTSAFGAGNNKAFQLTLPDKDGTASTTTAIITTVLNAPRGLTFGGDGNLYIASRGGNAIRRYAIDGATVTSASNLVTLTGAEAVTWDAATNRFLVGPNNSRNISAVTLAGALTNVQTVGGNNVIDIKVIGGVNYYTVFGGVPAVEIAPGAGTAVATVFNAGNLLAVQDYRLWTSGTGAWGTAANWQTNGGANALPTFVNTGAGPSPITFTGAGGVSTNDQSGALIGGLNIAAGAGTYSIEGNDFSLVPGSTVRNLSTNLLTLGTAAQTITAPGTTFYAGLGGNITIPAALILGSSANSVALTGPGNFALSGAVSGTADLFKGGTGTARLAGISSRSGATIVNGGTLLVNTVLGSTSGTAVNSGGTLGGIGLINSSANVTVATGGAISPGDGIGTLTTGPISFATGSAFTLEIGQSTADQLSVFGAATLTGAITLNLTLLATPNANALFTILDGTAPLSGGGQFSYLGNTLASDAVFKVTTGAFSQDFKISYASDGGNDVTLLAVPEPSGVALLLGGFGFIAGLRRRRK